MNGIIKLTMGGPDPPIQAYKCWMAGSEPGHGEEMVCNTNPKLL